MSLFDILHIIPVNQILLLVFNAPANATESDKRDLMKELDTMKQLKPHPYVIKLLGCVTESGMLWLCGSNFAVHILLIIYLVTLSSNLLQWKSHCFTMKHNKKPLHKVI